MKTILVPVEKHDAMPSVLETALLLARKFDSYIEGFPLRLGINELVTVDMGAAFPMEQFAQENTEAAKAARAAFEAFMQTKGIARAAGPDKGGLSFGWLEDAPEGEAFVGSYGRVFDLIAVSRPDADSIGLHNRALESGLFDSGRPILIAPPTPPSGLGQHALVAWNGSPEQARATAFALPLLKQAQRVTVLTVAGGAGVPGPTGEQMTRYLKLNGVPATALTVQLDGRSTGEAILAAVAAHGCDLLVKGAYTQSRLRQMIFGGATRHILAYATVPVLMAH